MISKHRRAWPITSPTAAFVPSESTGAVPDTEVKAPTRNAREKPIEVSNGDPEDAVRRAGMLNGCGYPPGRFGEQPWHVAGPVGDGNARRRHCGDLGLRCPRVARDDRAGVPHSLSWRCRSTRD